MEDIKSHKEYRDKMQRLEDLLQKADYLNGFNHLLEDELQEYKDCSIVVSKYEKEALKLHSLDDRSDLIIRIEEEMFNRRMNQKQFAEFMEVSPSTLSEVINKKTPVSMQFAILLYNKLGIDGNLILEHISAGEIFSNNVKQNVENKVLKTSSKRSNNLGKAQKRVSEKN